MTEQTADPWSTTAILTELLYLAVEYGTAAHVAWLLQQGAHPEGDFSDEGFSPLYHVCLHREIDHEREEIADLLLDAGADVNRVTATRSNLAIAARRGRVELVKLLLERGADPELTLDDFVDGVQPPLLNAAQHMDNEDLVRVVRDFLAKGI